MDIIGYIFGHKNKSAGDVTIPGGITFTVDSDLNGASPQFTLTCISTGGPATTVTWTRDSEEVVGSTVLDNTETATYTHTLTVTDTTMQGVYACTVSNRNSSTKAVASFHEDGGMRAGVYLCIYCIYIC